jgi:hydroxyacylglutathione hydrolase
MPLIERHAAGPEPSVPTVADLQQALATERWRVVDVRPAHAFVAAHLPGSVNVPFTRQGFRQAAARALPADRPLAVLADNPILARAAAAELTAAGYGVAAVVTDGLAAWRAAGLPTAGVEDIDPEELARRLAAGRATVVDVREPWEWAQGMIAGSRGLPLGELAERSGELDPSAPYVLVCATGTRSLQAAWLLEQRGFVRLANLRGGLVAWARAGGPLVPAQPSRC